MINDKNKEEKGTINKPTLTHPSKENNFGLVDGTYDDAGKVEKTSTLYKEDNSTLNNLASLDDKDSNDHDFSLFEYLEKEDHYIKKQAKKGGVQ